VQNLGLALGTVVVFLGLAEGVSRLREWRRPPPEEVAPYIVEWQDWDGDFYTVKSTAVGTPPWEDYNHDGLRDRDHAADPAPGVRRVVCLGDSTTLGWGIRPEEAYPQVLQDLLDARGAPVEVFNVALGGWSTRQEVVAYRKIVRRYRPGQVVLGVCLNDVAELQNNLSRPPRLLAALHARSALVRWAVGARDREIADVEELFQGAGTRKIEEAWARLFREIQTLRDEVRRDGGSLAVLVFPFALQLSADAPPAVPQARIAAFCRAEGLACLDLLPAVRATGESPFLDYDHFTPAGARQVAEAVLDSGIVGAASPPPPEADRATLIADLDSGDPARRAAAAWALGRLDAATPALMLRLARGLDDEAWGVRAGTAWALGRLGAGARPASASLAALLRDPEERVRWRAAEALGRIGPDAAALAGLRSALADPRARGEAASVLGKMRRVAREAVPDLLAALDDSRQEVRSRVIWALGEIGDPRATSRLIQAFDDPSQRWRAADALGALGPAGGEDAVRALVGGLADETPAVRWRAAQALGRMGSAARGAGPALAEAAADRDTQVRIAAAHALAGAEADPGLGLRTWLRALQDPDMRVRHEAVNGLGRLGAAAARARPALVHALGDTDPGVRAGAARALGRIGGLSSAEAQALHAAARDPHERVREAAIKALTDGPRTAVQALK
jgi:HEAT repeat protein/lysophospholipase L1-like esterase